MASPFEPMILGLHQLGVYLYLFPFLITLAVVYGILSYSLAEKLPVTARGLISIIFGFFVMLFSLWNPEIVIFFANIFGYGLILACAFLMILIVLGIMGIKPEDLVQNEKFKWPVVGIVILVFVIVISSIIANAFGFKGVETSEFWTVVLVIILIAMFMFWTEKSS